MFVEQPLAYPEELLKKAAVGTIFVVLDLILAEEKKSFVKNNLLFRGKIYNSLTKCKASE